MQTRPKKFHCTNCLKEYYGDSDVCGGCGAEQTVKPIPKEMYKCYLNGGLYGTGSLEYMHELFRDYVLTHKMYGKKSVDFQIVKC